MRAWAAPPTLHIAGLRAYRGVYAHTQGLTCERAMWLSGRYHPGQAPDNVPPMCSQPPWPSARQCARATHTPGNCPKRRPLRRKWVNLGCFVRGGLCFGRHAPSNCGCAAANRRELRHARLRHAGDTPQEGFAWRKTPIVASPKCAASPTSPGHSTGWREKIRPTPPLQWHFREKTRPARPLRRLFREKVRPARVITPNLGCCERAGRIFSRFHDLPATQGEFFRACRRRPSSALPISDRAPLVWRAPADPESPAAVPAGDGGVLP